jgi:hypothetical protein
MIKYNTYKTVSKVSLYGDDDELLNNQQSVYKTNNSAYKNCKKVKSRALHALQQGLQERQLQGAPGLHQSGSS